MKSIALALLFATVSAEAGFKCENPTDTPWTEATVDGATSASDCGAKCTTTASADSANDICCQAMVTAGTDGAAETVECKTYTIATGSAVDIRKAMATADGVSYEAWAWVAGAASADMKPTEAKDAKDSATMITSLVATFAAVAMVAY